MKTEVQPSPAEIYSSQQTESFQTWVFMKTKATVAVLLVACVVLAVLVLLQVIPAKAAGLGFAAALVVAGVASRGFRR